MKINVGIGLFGLGEIEVWHKRIGEKDLFYAGDLFFVGQLSQARGRHRIIGGTFWRGNKAFVLERGALDSDAKDLFMKVYSMGKLCEGYFDRQTLTLRKGKFHCFEGAFFQGGFKQGVFERGTFSYKGKKVYLSFYNGKWVVDDFKGWPFSFQVQRLNPSTAEEETQPQFKQFRMQKQMISQADISAYARKMNRCRTTRAGRNVYVLECFTSEGGRHLQFDLLKNLQNLTQVYLLEVADSILIPVIVRDERHFILLELDLAGCKIRVHDSFGKMRSWEKRFVAQIAQKLDRSDGRLALSIHSYQVEQADCQRQTDGYSCGVHVCNNIRKLMFGEPFLGDIQEVREKLLSQIKTKRQSVLIQSKLDLKLSTRPDSLFSNKSQYELGNAENRVKLMQTTMHSIGIKTINQLAENLIKVSQLESKLKQLGLKNVAEVNQWLWRLRDQNLKTQSGLIVKKVSSQFDPKRMRTKQGYPNTKDQMQQFNIKVNRLGSSNYQIQRTQNQQMFRLLSRFRLSCQSDVTKLRMQLAQINYFTKQFILFSPQDVNACYNKTLELKRLRNQLNLPSHQAVQYQHNRLLQITELRRQEPPHKCQLFSFY